MPASTTVEFRTALRDDDPPNPSRGKCTIDNLPNELLTYVFQLGVEIEQDESDKLPEYSKWKDIDDNGNIHHINLVVTDADDDDDDEVEEIITLPFQVLLSHVCRRWRSVALNTPRFWTTLTFRLRPALVQTKEYISRSNGLPLTIGIDCFTRCVDDEEDPLSLEELNQVLDLLEPASPQWGKFIFYSGSYTHTLCIMSRLDKITDAPTLESLQVHDIWDGTETAEHNTPFLPFNGQAPNLKDAAFRALPIDWDRALQNFLLQGLRSFQLSYPKKNAWPTYATFVKIITNSPELRILTLSNAGPLLADNSDPHATWGPIPLTIPSLTKLALRFHDQKYAIALVRHLDMPTLTHLDLDFDTIDYSDLVQALAKPVKGRDQSVLRRITHLTMTGLSFNLTTAKILLVELVSLKSLYLQPARGEDEIICNALIDPRLLPPIEQASVDLPTIFCPKLEEIATSLEDERVKALIAGRRDAGVPLKRIRHVPRMIPSFR